MLHKGLVVVWLVGPGRQTLVGHYRAQVSTADYQRFYPGVDRAQAARGRQASMLPAVQQHTSLPALSVPSNGKIILLTYPWQFALSAGSTLITYCLTYLSSESPTGPNTPDPALYVRSLLSAQPRPVPRNGTWWVRDEAGHTYRLRVRRFDEVETQAAFRTLHRAQPASPITLHLETDKYFKQASFVLVAGQQTTPLPKTQVEILPCV